MAILTLTPAERAACDDYRQRYGSRWRSIIRTAWETGRYPAGHDGTLQRLRNREHGPDALRH